MQKSAYIGVESSLVEGKTLHTIRMISRRKNVELSNRAKNTLRRFWDCIEYLDIDQTLMLAKSFLHV